MKLGNYTVKFRHDLEKGKTQCTILQQAKHNQDELEVVSVGASSVHHTDTYNRRYGRRVTLKRALASSDIPKEERTNIWRDYLTKKYANG